MTLRVLLLASVAVGCAAVAVYDPPDAGVALDAVEKALHNIVSSPHLTKVQLVAAKKVSSDVEKTVTELESKEGKKLSQEARASKVRAAIKELQDLQTTWQKQSDVLTSSKKAELMKQMKAKEEELAKDKKMLKVLNLQKALAEKKLALQKLIEQKTDEAAKKEAEKETKEKQDMITKGLDLAKDMQPKKALADEKSKPVMAYLEGRMHKATESLEKIDAADTKQQAEISALADKKMPVQDANDPLAKSQGILKMLAKKQHRQFLKAKVPIQNEIKELHTAITSIQKGDSAGLSKVMQQMQGELKTLQAKSHKFLY
jgi:hypothetical protein